MITRVSPNTPMDTPIRRLQSNSLVLRAWPTPRWRHWQLWRSTTRTTRPTIPVARIIRLPRPIRPAAEQTRLLEITGRIRCVPIRITQNLRTRLDPWPIAATRWDQTRLGEVLHRQGRPLFNRDCLLLRELALWQTGLPLFQEPTLSPVALFPIERALSQGLQEGLVLLTRVWAKKTKISTKRMWLSPRKQPRCLILWEEHAPSLLKPSRPYLTAPTLWRQRQETSPDQDPAQTPSATIPWPWLTPIPATI